MNREDRAKQFMAFDALKGLQEELRKKEIEYEEKRDLSDSTLEELGNKLNALEKGTYTRIKYYRNKQYIEISGTVTNIDYNKRKIKIDETNINICDILEIKKN
ncbi:MAG: YolD-like family protein [Clostridia bacterium]|nr:YolD-like family protein [Clostridia bacterium]